jgi:tetratricopeptide (TPR) repeat protein
VGGRETGCVSRPGRADEEEARAFVVDNMGWFAFGRGETLEARRHFEEALTLFRAIGEIQGTSDQLMDPGRVAYTLGDYDEGRRLLEESRTIQQAVGLKNTILNCACQELLGEIASAQGQFAEAEARFRQQLVILLAWRVQDRSHLLVTLDALMGLATILANENDVERAVEVLALVRAAARIDRRTETKAEQVTTDLEARLSPARFAAAQARGRALELGATVVAILAEGAAYLLAVTASCAPTYVVAPRYPNSR